MNKLKSEFIKAIMQSLKIDDNPFISATIDEFISHIKPTEYKQFMSALFGTQHQYLNGLDRVAKVAEQFNPAIVDNSLELKAKELILWCESANSTVFDNSTKSGRTFEDELSGTKFMSLSDNDLYILNSVKPHSSHKQLIGNIRGYQDSTIQLQAFIQALKFIPSDAVQIANPLDRLQIKKG